MSLRVALSRGREMLRQQGAAGAVRRMVHWLSTEAERLRTGEPDWLKQQREIDRSFDARYGVDTGGFVNLTFLDVHGENRRHGVRYVASQPEGVLELLGKLDVRHEDYTFVDFGSGKGRVLLLAANWPFRRIIGVEFAQQLHQAARRNVQQYVNPEQRCRRIELHCMDATEYELPDEPLILYFYNPFGAEVMRKVAERTFASYLRHPRQIYVLYVNPVQEKFWTDAGFHSLARGDLFSVLCPPAWPSERAEVPGAGPRPS